MKELVTKYHALNIMELAEEVVDRIYSLFRFRVTPTLTAPVQDPAFAVVSSERNLIDAAVAGV
jgi:hypothetical protein